MKVIVFKMYGLAGNVAQGPLTLYIHVGCKNLGNRADKHSLEWHSRPEALVLGLETYQRISSPDPTERSDDISCNKNMSASVSAEPLM